MTPPMMPRPKLDRQFFRDVWGLTKPYWTSEDRWRGGGLLVLVVALNFGSVYMAVRFNYLQGALYNALQQYNASETARQMALFAGLAAVYVAIAVYEAYFAQALQIRWRRWLTEHYLDKWLADKAFYRLQLFDQNRTDNPDQRIQEDLADFPRMTLNLSLGFTKAVVRIVSFMGILWGLIGALTIPLGPFGSVTIPGFGVWAAVIYAVFGTWVTVKLGRPLVSLNFMQQRYEADFRYSMIRVRENAESIAFFDGEPRETAIFERRFGAVYRNYWSIMNRQMLLGFFTVTFSQLATFVPIALGIGPYFAKRIQLGGITQLMEAFDQVQSALAWIVTNYSTIAGYQSVVLRLTTFQQHMADASGAGDNRLIRRTADTGSGLSLCDIHLSLPDGRVLLDGISLDVAPGAKVLLTGPSGIGKSTLLRAVAGLWPFAEGTINSNFRRSLFLPQKPYLPMGSLREVLLYPYGDAATSDSTLATALEQAGLRALTGALGDEENWAGRLSLGEQQRINFARILLQHPDAIFMDEATSALDEAAEAELFGLLDCLPDRPTVLSIGHRSTLRAFHDRVLELTPSNTGTRIAIAAE